LVGGLFTPFKDDGYDDLGIPPKIVM